MMSKKKRSSLKFPHILSPNVGASREETHKTYPLCDPTLCPTCKGGPCLNFAYYSMQLYNPGGPKGGGHGTMLPPKYAPAPSIFDVPASCLPTPRPPRRPAKQVDKQLEIFLARDRIKSFNDFVPDKKFKRTMTMSWLPDHPTSVLFFSCHLNFVNVNWLCLLKTNQHCVLPLCFAYKNGIRVPLGTILNPNNGLSSYSQFDTVVHTCLSYKRRYSLVCHSWRSMTL